MTIIKASVPDTLYDAVQRDKIQSEKLATMQRAINEGLESGDAGILDMQSIKQKARLMVKQ